jgi:hypothetical protein
MRKVPQQQVELRLELSIPIFSAAPGQLQNTKRRSWQLDLQESILRARAALRHAQGIFGAFDRRRTSDFLTVTYDKKGPMTTPRQTWESSPAELTR